MPLFLGALLSILAKAIPMIAKGAGTAARGAGGAAKAGGGLLKSGGSSLLGGLTGGGGGASGQGGGFGGLLSGGGLGGKLKDVVGGNIPGASGQIPVSGGGGNPLQGFFDMLGGTHAQAPGQLGDIVRASQARQMGPLGQLRAAGAKQLQSSMGDMAKNAISQGIGNIGGGGGGGQAQGGGVSFPSVPAPAQPIQLPPLPEYNLPSHDDVSGLRAQLLQEILAQGSGGGGF